jgi:outer membrane immunogenic protein
LNRILIAFLTSPLVVGGAFAADLPIVPPQRFAPSIPQRAVEWTGLYFGVNAGYGWAQDASQIVFLGGFPGGTTTQFGLGATELSGTRVIGSGGLSGAVAGGQMGFNWQAGMVVFGAEIDGQWSGQRGTFTANCGVGCTAAESVRIRSIVTARGRIGVALDWLMPYVTAGGAFINARDDLTMTVGGVTANFLPLSGTRVGWVAGAGVEVALAGNWSAKLEYLHLSANNVSGTTSIPGVLGDGGASEGADYRDNLVRAGLNYRFGPSGGPGMFAAAPWLPRADYYARNEDVLRSVEISTDKARIVKRAPAEPVVARSVGAGPIVADADPKRLPSISDEPRPMKWGEEVENFDSAPPQPVTSSKNRREKPEDEGQRLKRIMAICDGC